ncbi:response regulator [Alkalihalobacillus trypoxylicola]|uniref:LuxR family transcriptional regulator n=1 Tax=Alkalihalobacillus trypoxylicola TaxID=519424 RepID=A0A161Q1F6_9BACI|nr:response regulator transcription factor [Alkalihalobacillus trypoxylicola]KYG29323.1 LuxR family transcriptional regulator [Alkalihalobacillus trypoxylicola]
MNKLKILIVDDQTLMREGLKTIIDLEDDMTVVATANNGSEAIKMARQSQPDLILMDIQMPSMNGIESLIEIKKESEQVRVLILTTFADDDYIISSFLHGADGFLMKDMNYDQLIQSIRNAASGQLMIPHTIAQKLVKKLVSTNAKDSDQHQVFHQYLKQEGIQFSNREMEVADLLAQGFSNKKIAESLFISEGTVKNYISEIYSKIGVNGRAKAVVYLNNFKK